MTFNRIFNAKLAIACALALAVAGGRLTAAEIGGSEASDRDMNIRVNPLGLLIGSISGDVDFKIADRFTLGPTIGYLSASLLTTKLGGFDFGLRGNYYLSGSALTTGWYVGPSLGLSAISLKSPGFSGSSLGMFVSAKLGRQWVWNNGLNVNVALGASYYSHGGSLTDGGTTFSVPFFHGVTPAGEVTIGYSF